MNDNGITIEKILALKEEDDYLCLIDPMNYSVNIYDRYEEYRKGMDKLSKPKQYLFAVNWFIAEVWNGGISQFFANSTGIVWKDALEGFNAIGLMHIKENFQEILDKIGEPPKFDRKQRLEQLEKIMPDIDDFYALDNISDRLYNQDENDCKIILKYIKTHAEDFV